MNRAILTTIFLGGAAFGVLANEVVNNSLYVFNSGDPIVAAEVNHNFDLLSKRIQESDAIAPVLGRWFECEGDDGSTSRQLSLWYNNQIESNELWSANGSGATWSYNVESNVFRFDSVPAIEAKIFPKIGDS